MARTFGAERELLRNLLLATRVVLVLRDRCARDEREDEHAAHTCITVATIAPVTAFRTSSVYIHIPADWWCV